jgi:diguanylate cyclase (GGDEF)-like protein
LEGEEGTFETRLQRQDGQPLGVSVQLRQLRWKRRAYVIGFVRDVTSLEETIARLRQQVEEQKNRAFEAIKSSLRLYQFNEKIKRTPQLTKSLLHLEIEENLFAEAANILTSEEGLGYKEASFVLAESSVFRVVYSTMAGMQGRTYSVIDDHRYSRFVRNSFRQEDDSSPTLLVPLQSRGQFLGLFEVTSHSKEKLFFDESSMVVEWQKDVLQDIGGILALLLDNLRLNRELKRQSTVDPLTQTYNRHHFAGRLAAEVRRARRYSRPTSLVFIDIDNFKQINDGHGHLQGDQVLRDMGQLLVNDLREVDVVCRYGGDEFVLLLPETDGEMAMQTAEKIRQRVAEFAFHNLDNPDVTIAVTISVGVSTLGATGSEDELLQKADAALYDAKRCGRNKVTRSGSNE